MLSTLNGIPANGTWTLKVKDVVATTTGTISSWQLQLTYPALACNVPFVQEAPAAPVVRTPLGEILPLLADAVASNRTWLGDFADDPIRISSDLHDVLQAYRHFRRPGA